jgi:hypothetical protein
MRDDDDLTGRIADLEARLAEARSAAALLRFENRELASRVWQMRWQVIDRPPEPPALDLTDLANAVVEAFARANARLTDYAVADLEFEIVGRLLPAGDAVRFVPAHPLLPDALGSVRLDLNLRPE